MRNREADIYPPGACSGQDGCTQGAGGAGEQGKPPTKLRVHFATKTVI